MPEGFSSIADLKVVIDAQTEGLRGGMELAQGLISRFQTDADDKLGLFDRSIKGVAGGVEFFVGRLGAVGVALGVAGQAIEQFRLYGKQLAEATGTQDEFAKLEKAVDGFQDAIVSGLYGALDGAKQHATAFGLSLASMEADVASADAGSKSFASTLIDSVTAAIDGVTYSIRRLGPDAKKTFEQLEKELVDYADRIARVKAEIAAGPVEVDVIDQMFGVPTDDQLQRQKDYLKNLEMQRWLTGELTALARIGRDLDEQARKDKAAQEAAAKTIEGLDREIKSLETKTATLGMTASALAAYTAQQKIAADLEGKGVEITESVQKELDTRVGKIRALTAQVEAYNKAQKDKADHDRQEAQAKRILEGLDAEVDAQRRKGEGYTRTAAEAAALERRERALLAIKQTGKLPSEQEIAQIDAKTEALRQQLAVNEQIKKSQDEMREYTKVVTSSMETAFRQFASGAQVSVKNMVRSMLQDMALLAIKQNVLGPMTQGLGSMLGSVFGPAAGGGWSTQVIPAFADGGRPPLDRPSLIGERGPELFLPDRPGSIVPNEALAGRGDIYLSIDARGATHDAVAALEQSLAPRIIATMRDARERGAF